MVKRFNPNTSKETPFKIAIDKQSQAMNQLKKKERTAMYASDYGGCMRKTWFQFHPELYPVEAEVDAQTARVFANGNDVHERLSSYLKEEVELKFIEEVPIPRDELEVHGRCDGIAEHNERFHVLEFKSINAMEVKESKDEHEGQLSWYLEMFEKYRNELREEFELGQFYPSEETLKTLTGKTGRVWADLLDVEKRLLLSQGPVKGELIYESKMNQSTHHFPIEYDEEKVDKVRAWFTALKEHITNGRKPEVHYDKGSFPCSWGKAPNVRRCAYFEYCHGERKPSTS